MLFKRAHIRGMVHELTRQGIVEWPSKLAMDEAADAIADDFTDEEIPEQTGDTGLNEDQAAAALGRIVEVAEDMANKVGQYDPNLQKVAASQHIQDAAASAAIELMEKAAKETSVPTGPDMPGATPPAPELGATAEAEVDAANTPSADVVVPQGTTSLDTKPGAVGKEDRRPDQPGAQEGVTVNEAAKTASGALTSLASMLQQLGMTTGTEKKAEMDGASLSGSESTGPAPEPRIDVQDNLNIPDVKAPGQGKTVHTVPAKAETGVTKAQPGGTPGPTDATPNEPAKDRKTASLKEVIAAVKNAEGGAEILAKIAKECMDTDKSNEEAPKKEEGFPFQAKKEEKKTEEDEKEKEKSASLALIAKALIAAAQ